MYNAGEYAAAEKEILNFIDQSTPHAYWLARSFILLSDVYVAMDKKLDARQYLLSLQQNYHADDDIERNDSRKVYCRHFLLPRNWPIIPKS